MRSLRCRQNGSVVLVALCFVAVLGIAVGTYLALSTQAMKLSNRGFQTALSEHLAEMGLEYGIAAMNSGTWSSWTSGNGTTASWTTSGTVATGLVSFPSGKFGNIGVTGLINVRINNFNIATNAGPWDSAADYTANTVVSYNGSWYTCTASYTANPSPPPASTLRPTDLGAPWSASISPVIHAEGMVTLPDGSSSIKTQVVATLTYPALFPNALAGTTSVTLGAGVTVDSFDSSLGTYNQITAPFSPGAPNTGYAAVLAGGSNSSSTYAVTLAGAVTVDGYLAAPSIVSAPLSPNISYDASTSIVKGTPGIPSPKVDLSRVSRSPYIPKFSVNSVVGGTLLTLAQGSDTSIGFPGALAPTIYYTTANLDFTDPLTTLTINGPVVINVAGDINIGTYASGSKIIVYDTGSAEIHFSGAFYCVDPSGTGGIDNQTLNPLKLIFVSPSSLTSHAFDSTINFYGAIYVPNGTIAWNGGNLFGAISANVVNVGGGALHYDTALRKLSVGGAEAPYVISKWREVIGPTDPDRVAF